MPGGGVDRFLMRIMDALLSLPGLVIAIAIVGSLGPDIQNVMIALGVVSIPGIARLVRGSTLAVMAEEYVTAARTVGVPGLRIMARHILPNIIAPILVQTTLVFSSAIVAEASLSFLGLGTQPPTPSWGRDMNDGRAYITQAPWLVLAPGIVISISVMAINFLGDGLRDALDPRYRTR